MSKKRYISDDFWTDPYIEKLDLMEKGVFLYLLTNPLCNVAGIYEISLKRLAYETGLDISIANTILDRFVRDGKIARHDNWIILWKFGKHQVLNPSIESGVRRIWGELPDEVQAVAGCDSLSYFTLLNLTYRVAPKITKTIKEEHKTFFKTTKPKKTKNLLAQAKDICRLFSEQRGGSYNNTIHLEAVVGLLELHGIDRVTEVAMYGLSLKPKEFRVQIKKPVDLADHWYTLTQMMITPEKKVIF